MKSAFSKFHLSEIREIVLLLLSRKCTLAEAPFAKAPFAKSVGSRSWLHSRRKPAVHMPNLGFPAVGVLEDIQGVVQVELLQLVLGVPVDAEVGEEFVGAPLGTVTHPDSEAREPQSTSSNHAPDRLHSALTFCARARAPFLTISESPHCVRIAIEKVSNTTITNHAPDRLHIVFPFKLALIFSNSSSNKF